MATTTYMILDLPEVGVTTGPSWATKLNTALGLIDAHDHSTGKGTPVTPSGININSDLTFAGYQATALKTAAFSNQAASLASSFQRCAYVANGDLYYNNGSGTAVQLTTGGSINVSSVNGISGLAAPASASFSTPDFVFKSDATTYGKIDASDLKIFPYSAGATNSITLKASASIASSFSFTLPTALPGATSYMASDASGNLSLVTADAIGSAMTATGANAIGSAMASASACNNIISKATNLGTSLAATESTTTLTGSYADIATVSIPSAGVYLIFAMASFIVSNTSAAADVTASYQATITDNTNADLIGGNVGIGSLRVVMASATINQISFKTPVSLIACGYFASANTAKLRAKYVSGTSGGLSSSGAQIWCVRLS